ncbi:MAG: hypothetical protein JNM72_06330 [Deltaproteobacteria bacterium]|nr:hypothetical protein [Deltaproteobacteria bacterium]
MRTRLLPTRRAALAACILALAVGPTTLGLGCWAPSPADHPNLAGAPPPPAVAAPRGADLPSAAPGALAWTRSAPLTLVGPGGEPAVTLDRIGVLVQVQQAQAHRVRVRCLGCPDPAPTGDLWLQAGQLAGGPGEDEEALSAALRLRARWAAGADLPAGADPAALCALIDAGFAWNTDEARFAWGGGELLLALRANAWAAAELSPPSAPAPWPCAGPAPAG